MQWLFLLLRFILHRPPEHPRQLFPLGDGAGAVGQFREPGFLLGDLRALLDRLCECGPLVCQGRFLGLP
ncbi:MAG: hypothetical protein PHE55_03485 [Methylococcaceae bacterium]|nr:hypothetical protein [Methylococcaceae bacterium]